MHKKTGGKNRLDCPVSWTVMGIISPLKKLIFKLKTYKL